MPRRSNRSVEKYSISHRLPRRGKTSRKLRTYGAHDVIKKFFYRPCAPTGQIKILV
jgi:hypothetical protein